MAKKNEDKDNPGALFIPAGVLTGMGVGYWQDQFLAGLFIGLGVGFILFALTSFYFAAKRSSKNPE